MDYKLGKNPARIGAYGLRLTDYIAALPAAPAVFGHQTLIPNFGMLGNDTVGDCVFAGAGHETMLWGAEANHEPAFTTKAVLSDYSAVTGYNPNDPNSDCGTDMEVAAKYRRKTGVIDGNNTRHTVDAYLALPGVSARGSNVAGFTDTLASAAYVFGGVGVGIQFPSSAMDQFNHGAPWTVVVGSQIEGGHYVPLVGRDNDGYFLVITWGQVQRVAPEFLQKYVDEAIVYLSLERLTQNKSLDGFDIAALQADLAALSGNPTPTPTPEPTPTPATADQELWNAVQKWTTMRHTRASNNVAAALTAWAYVKGLS